MDDLNDRLADPAPCPSSVPADVSRNPLKAWLWALAAGWTLLVGLALWWTVAHFRETERDLARAAARSAIGKDILGGRWHAPQGDAHAPATGKPSPVPAPADSPERDGAIPPGRPRAPADPGRMARQLRELGNGRDAHPAHVTSLRPIRPENAPDDWERKALEAFARGNTEFSSVESIGAEPHLRLMQPLRAAPGCLACHAAQGYKKGDILGGIGVAVPIKDYAAIVRPHRREELFAHSAIWALGLLLLGAAGGPMERRRRERDAAEAALRESEGRFRAIFEDSPVAIWEEDFSNVKDRLDALRRSGVVDLRAHFEENPGTVADLAARVRVLAINEASVRVFGAATKDQVFRELPRYFTAESFDVFKEEIVALAEGATRFRSETPHLTAEGKPVVFDLTVSIQHGHEDTLSRVLVSFVDVTERRRAEEALRESEERLNKAQEIAHVGSWELDLVANRLTWSDEVYRIFGLSPQASPSTYETFLDAVHPDDRAAVDAAYSGSIRDGKDYYEIEHRVVRKSTGEVRQVREKCEHVRDSRGKIVRSVGMVHDITESRRAEEALRESEERFRSLVEQAGDGFQVTDAEGRYVDANSATCRQLGYSREELLSLNVTDIDPSTNPERYAATFQALADSPPIMFETVHRRKDGTKFPVEVNASVIRIGGTLRALSLARDITDRKRAEEEREHLRGQLAHAQKMESVGRLAGGVAHDFNNMLTVILGHTEMGLLRTDTEQRVHANLAAIEKAARRSADLIRQLLAFARKQTVAPRVLDLNDTVAGMLKMLRRLIGEDIDLAWMPGAGLWPVKIDPTQVDQLLANLCVNARDAIAGEGKVTIRTENVTLDEAFCADRADVQPGAFVMLAVSDDGCGMDEDVLEHIFEPFFTTKEVGRGTGLGLATVYGIVKQNGGYLGVSSRPGQGTTFNIYLNRCDEEAAEAKVPGAAELPKSRGETVLLVEDEEAVLEMGRAMLQELGYTVLAAGAPQEAIRKAQTHPGEIHLLVTDVVMPEMDGRMLTKRLAAIRPGIRCLFVSGYTADVIANRGVLDDGVQFLQKPFSLEALAAKVREALG